MAAGGEMLPYPTQTTAAASSNYGVVAGEALPLASQSQVFCQKTTSAPAVVAVGKDKVAGAFPERLRRGLPVLGLSAASLAVAGLVAAGEPATPAAGFGLFLMLIVGMFTVTMRVLRD